MRTALADALAAITLVALSLVLWAPRLHGPIDLRWDAGVYYILGTSLAQGQGYRLLNEPGAIEAVQYPPVLPAIVALHQRALGSSDPAVVGPALRVTAFAIFTLYVLVAHRLARRHLPAGLALFVGLVAALHAQTLFLSNLLFAEGPFMLFSMAFLWSQRRPEGVVRTALGGVLAALAYGTRTAGVAVLLAWVLDALVRREWKLVAARVALAALPVIAWQSYIARVVESPAYRAPAYAYQRADYHYYNVPYSVNSMLVDPFVPELGRATTSDLLRRVTDNLRALPIGLGAAVSAPRDFWQADPDDPAGGFPLAPLPPALVAGLLVGLSALIVVGGCVLLARGEWLLPIYLGGSVALVCLTPWPGQFTRYFTPLTALLAIALAVGLAWLRERADATGRAAPSALATLLAVGIVAAVLSRQYFVDLQVRLHHSQLAEVPRAGGGTIEAPVRFFGARWAAQDRALAWLRDHAEADAIVATSTPHRTYLVTGLRATMPAFEPDPARAEALMDTVPIRYLIVDDLAFLDVTRRYGQPVVDHDPDGWRLVHEELAGPDDPDDPTAASRIYRRVVPDAEPLDEVVGPKPLVDPAPDAPL